MEAYKNNMAECTHSAKWQENMLGRKCEDCGFDSYQNEHGMYGNYRPNIPPRTLYLDNINRINKRTIGFHEYWFCKLLKMEMDKYILNNIPFEQNRIDFVFSKLEPEE